MGKIDTLPTSQVFTGHFVVRLLIVSYFVALAFGIIDGTDLAVLMTPFLPEFAAKVISGFGVVGLSVMILFGFHRRLAALLLAIILFWCSYLASISPAGFEDIGSFWRDLALIGALLLTYADAPSAALSPDYGTLPQGGKLVADGFRDSEAHHGQSSPEDTAPQSQKTLFREDFDIVRAT